jgi:hypothetical protein
VSLGKTTFREALVGLDDDVIAGVCCAFAVSAAHGLVIGKARDNECWHGVGGKEYRQTIGFRFVRVRKVPEASSRGLTVALQAGYGALWFAVAHTAYGSIPGKATLERCWYTYGGKEYETETDFHYLSV